MEKLLHWIFLAVAILVIGTSTVALYHGMTTIAGTPEYQAAVAAIHKPAKDSPATVARQSSPATCTHCASLAIVR